MDTLAGIAEKEAAAARRNEGVGEEAGIGEVEGKRRQGIQERGYALFHSLHRTDPRPQARPSATQARQGAR